MSLDSLNSASTTSHNKPQNGRTKTMYLSTVKTERKKLFKTCPKPVNVTSDIKGAIAPERMYPYTNKPDYSIGCTDVKGARPIVPKQFSDKYKDRKINDCSDIEGTKPRPRGFKTSRSTNPLNPDYKPLEKISKNKTRPETTTSMFRFLGERMMNVSDIPGTKPNKLYRWKERKTNKIEDIEGTRPRAGKQSEARDKVRDSMNVNDIVKVGFKSKRVTNPLDSAYKIHGRVVEIDQVKSKPKALPKLRNGPNLMGTRDIPGAYPGWFPDYKKKEFETRQINRTDDIKGAQSDTLSRGLKSVRKPFNPLDPDYVGVDGTKLGDVKRPNTPPAEKSTFFRKCSEEGSELSCAKRESLKKKSTGAGDGSSQRKKSFEEKRREKVEREEREMARSLE